MIRPAMNFLSKQRYPIMVLAVLALSCVLVTYQFAHNESRHVKTRENFIYVSRLDQIKPAEHLYQTLIQSLADLPDRTLLADLQRLEILDLKEKQPPGSLLAKYRTAVHNVLERRVQRRVTDLLEKGPRENP